MLKNSISVQSPYHSSEIYILDPQLTYRVNQRAPVPDVAADILQRLTTRGLFSAELCETIRDEPEVLSGLATSEKNDFGNIRKK